MDNTSTFVDIEMDDDHASTSSSVLTATAVTATAVTATVVTSIAVTATAGTAASTSTSTIVDIDLSCKYLDSNVIKGLIHSAKEKCLLIKVLKLSFNQLKNDGAKCISSYILTNNNNVLEHLDISFNDIEDDGMNDIVDAIIIKHTPLKMLNLSGNLLTSCGSQKLAALITSVTTIEALYLGGNSYKQEGCMHLSCALMNNMTLKKLCFNGNKINHQGATLMSRILHTHSSIIHLNLSDNNIGDEGACAIGHALMTYRKLRSLELSFNSIHEAGLMKLLKPLHDYSSLEVLNLDNNKIGGGFKYLSLVLETMCSIETLNVGYNNIDPFSLLQLLASVMKINLKSLCLSGNIINIDVAKSLQIYLHQTSSLNMIYLDCCSISPTAERYIASGIASNHNCSLSFFSGFALGSVLTDLKAPMILSRYVNGQTLEFLKTSWMKRKAANLQLQQHNANAGGVSGTVSAIISDNNNCDSDNGDTNNYDDSSECVHYGISSSYNSIEDLCDNIVHHKNIKHHIKSSNSRSSSSNQVGSITHSLSNNKALRSNSNANISGKSTNSIINIIESELQMQPMDTAVDRLHSIEINDKIISSADINRYIILSKKIAALPFHAGELWQLNQYYMSPPSMNTLSMYDDKNTNAEISSDDREDDSDCRRPHKKQSNAKTMSRICQFPNVQKILNLHRYNEEQVLSMYRQLKYFEVSLMDNDVIEYIFHVINECI